MTDKLWCQMCGKEQFTASQTCSYCWAAFLRDPKPEDGLLEEVLLAKLAKRDAFIEKLIEAGNGIMDCDPELWPDSCMTWQSLVAECRETK